MDIFENLENLNVSEECFDSIMDIVEELLDEGRLVDDDGKRTEAYYDWKNKVLDDIQDKKATASAIRKHETKLSKASKKEEKRIGKEELPKAEYDVRIAWGDTASTNADYQHFANKENPSTEEKRIAKNLKGHLERNVEREKEARQKLQNVKNKIGNAAWNAYKHEENASKQKTRAKNLSSYLDRFRR